MRTTALVCILALAATCGVAAPPLAITSYFTNTVITPAAFTNAGDTGLTVSNRYICLKLADITTSEYTSALVTNDVRPFVSAIVETLRTAIAAKASTNQFTTYTVTVNTRYADSGTNRTIYRAISEQQIITLTPTYGSE